MRRADETGPERDASVPALPRLFLREPGWRVGHKHTSEREFCFQVSPGEDSHHRIAHGEVYVYSADEKLCLPCADRRGLLHFEPKPLRKTVVTLSVPEPDAARVEGDTIPVLDRHGVSPEDGYEPPSLRE